MDSLLTLFERIMICITPLVVAFLAYRSSKNEKQTKAYMKSQEDLKAANDLLAKKEKQELENHFKSIEQSVDKIGTRLEKFEEQMIELSAMDKQISNLVQMSNINFEFCTSLSAIVTSIGNALDSSDVISSEGLSKELNEHQKQTRDLVGRVCKIVY